MDEEFKLVEEKLEVQRKSYFMRQMDLKDEVSTLSKLIRDRTACNDKDINFLKDMSLSLESNFKHMEYYMNKVLPIKSFSASANMLYSTIG